MYGWIGVLNFNSIHIQSTDEVFPTENVPDLGREWAGANRALPDVMKEKSEMIASTVGDMLKAKTKTQRNRVYEQALKDKEKKKDTRLSRILQSPRIISVYIRHRAWGSHYRAKGLESATYVEKNVIGRCSGVSHGEIIEHIVF